MRQAGFQGLHLPTLTVIVTPREHVLGLAMTRVLLGAARVESWPSARLYDREPESSSSDEEQKEKDFRSTHCFKRNSPKL
jgi:hypothetical protein